MSDIEEALAIIWDRCQHCKDVKEALEILRGERPQGKWIPIDEFSDYYKCSNCSIMIDNDLDFPKWRNFCPNCGADMRKEGDEK